MDYLPRGANFIRAKFLWEIGLHIAGNPATPYYGNRDLCITVGSGSGATYKPWLRMSCGSPILAQEHILGHHPVDPGLFKPRPNYLLQVRGMSMRDAGMLDGDWVAVHKTREARDGQIVVARIGDDVTVKTYSSRRNAVELLPLNLAATRNTQRRTTHHQRYGFMLRQAYGRCGAISRPMEPRKPARRPTCRRTRRTTRHCRPRSN